MTFIYRDDPHNADSGLMDLLDRLQAGDCIEVESFSCAAGSAGSFLLLMEQLTDRGIRFRSTREQFDTAAPEAAYTLSILKAIAHMNDAPAEKENDPEAEKTASKDRAEAEEAEAAKGRRPIDVDPESFDSILKRWRSGEITAKQAMNELGLKPNTFYRRVRQKMNDVNGEDILNAAKKFGKDFAENARQEAADFQESAGKFAAEHDLGSIPHTVIEQVGKGFSTAGSFLNKSLEVLTREISNAVQHFENQVRQEAAQETEEAPEEKAEEPMPAEEEAMDAQVEEIVEEAPVPAEDDAMDAAAEEPEDAPAEQSCETAEEPPQAPAEEDNAEAEVKAEAPEEI